MTRLPAVLLLACATGLAHSSPFQPDLSTLQATPRVELPAAAVEKARAEPVKGQPFRFAVPVEFELAPRQGVWLERDGTASWRVRIQSRGARSLSLHLPQPSLPPGATLWTYDPRGRLVHGPYDAARLGRSGLWTPPVSGDELVVEIRAPAGEAGTLELGSARAFHGVDGWHQPAAAGSCNVDITCPQSTAWTQDAGSVARIQIGGSILCTGQLLNNVRQNRRRLFLTANHCGIDTENGGPADSVMFYFNYTGPCGNNVADPLPPPTFQGATVLARDIQADFTLLLITDPAPLPAGAYFAGWDATGGTPTDTGASIHHPSGDDQKIALHDTAPAQSPVNIGTRCIIPAWQVTWSEGTTEPGSSGAGLWNSAHRLIGTLSGGYASCSTPSQPDYFARLDRAWTAQADASGQLKAHLDPDNTCVATVPGLDPATSPPPGPIAPTVDNVACSGQRSTCSGRRRGGGGALDALALALLALAARRRLQHHQQHTGHRQR